MKFEKVEYFPTYFFELIWTEEEIIPLLKEVQEKKEEIKAKNNVETGDYWTDYSDTVDLLEYEKIIEKVSTYCLHFKLEYSHIEYWTAIYGEKGYHASHNHNGSLFERKNPNMSSILCLSDIGETQFRNPYQSDQYHPELTIPSRVGKMIIFPSHILHTAHPHGKKNEERIIISSNWIVQETFPGSFYNE